MRSAMQHAPAHKIWAQRRLSRLLQGGYTARMVSKFRPKAPIIVTTTNQKVARQLALTWGTYPLLTEKGYSTDEVFDLSIQRALEAGYIKGGDLVIITAGVPVGVAGTTNTIKVHIAGEVLVKGVGIGKKSAMGRVRIVADAKEAAVQFEEGDVLVTQATDKEMVPFMEKAAAIITEEGGLTSCGNRGIAYWQTCNRRSKSCNRSSERRHARNGGQHPGIGL